jgi:hydroxymethylbilane synthase
MQTLKLLTRASPLAIWQARYVAGLLEASDFFVELLPMETSGDKKLDVSLSRIGEKGLFTKELEASLLNGQAHLAVHSAKDMPSTLPEGLELIAFTERENPADVLVSFRKDIRLGMAGLRIGTSSTRRVAMLNRHFPLTEVISVRGNLQTRFLKMQEGACDAMILARAGVTRMGLGDYITEELSTSMFTPAAGQASLAIEVACNLPENVKKAIRSAVNHTETEQAVNCERAFLRTMEGGCSIPVFALCKRSETGAFCLDAGIISIDGKEEVRRKREIYIEAGGESLALDDLGQETAREILSAGGAGILEGIRYKGDS